MQCKQCRQIISRSMDSGEALPSRVIGHTGECESCKGFHKKCLELSDRLAKEAERQRQEVSADVHAKIMRGLRENFVGARFKINVRQGWRSWGSAMAAAVVLAAILAVQLYHGTRPKPGASADGVIGTEAIGWLEVVNANTAVSIEEAVQRPMREEIRLLSEDGKTAAEFLLVCLPLNMDALARNERP